MGNTTDALGERMKRYENASRSCLTRKIPVIIRVDGKAFHTFTKGMKRPFDGVIMTAMQETMKCLCENIQGCVFGYTQSDEITLVLTDYKTIKTDAWFGYGVQKIASITASMATVAFNKAFKDAVEQYNRIGTYFESQEEYEKYKTRFDVAMFDARAFSVPVDDVCNCLIWRQKDATRNSISSVGQAYFSHKQLHGKNCNEIQEMLWQEKKINWNNLATDCKRGAACYRKEEQVARPNPFNPEENIIVNRKRWIVDKEIPIFTQNREFIERWI